MLDAYLESDFIFFVTEPKILCEVGTEVKDDEAEGENCCERLTFFPALNETTSATEGVSDPSTPEPCSHTEDCPDIRTILQELLPGEKVLCHWMMGLYR